MFIKFCDIKGINYEILRTRSNYRSRLVFAFMVLMGATGNDTEVGKYQIAANDREIFMLDTVTGTLHYYEKLG